MRTSPRARDALIAFAITFGGVALLAARIRHVGIDVPVGPDLTLWAGPLLGFPRVGDAVPPAFGLLTRLAAAVTGNLGDGGRLVSLLAAGALPGVAWLAARAWGLTRFAAALLAVLLAAAADVAVAGALFQPDALGMFVLLGLVGLVGVVRAERPTYIFAVVFLGGLVALQVRELLAPVLAMAAAALATGAPARLRALLLLAVLLVGPGLVALAPHLTPALREERALLPVADLMALPELRSPMFLGVKDIWWPLGDARTSAAIHTRYATLIETGTPGTVMDAVALNARQALAIAGDVDLLLAAGAAGWVIALARRKERAAIVGLALLLPAAWTYLFWAQRRHHVLFLAPALLGLVMGIDALVTAASEPWRRVLRVVAVLVVVAIAAPQLAAGHAAQVLLATRLDTYPEEPASARELAAAGRAITALAAPGDAFAARPDSPQERVIPALVAGLPVSTGDCPLVGVTMWTPMVTLRSRSGSWVEVEGADPPVARCAARAKDSRPIARPQGDGAPPPEPPKARPPQPAGRPLARDTPAR